MTPMHGTDLEAIVTLLELGAIELTPDPSARFTFEQLLAEARRYGGDEITLDERDVRIVLADMKSIKHERGLYKLV
jgi:hypothetical protein